MTKTDSAYYARRCLEERTSAKLSSNSSAILIHLKMAETYELMAAHGSLVIRPEP